MVGVVSLKWLDSSSDVCLVIWIIDCLIGLRNDATLERTGCWENICYIPRGVSMNRGITIAKHITVLNGNRYLSLLCIFSSVQRNHLASPLELIETFSQDTDLCLECSTRKNLLEQHSA